VQSLPDPLDRREFDAATLMAEYPPRLHNANKQVVCDIASPPGSVHRGRIGFTRWAAMYVGRDASGNDMKTLVPTVIGRTAEAERKKSVSRGPGRQWDEEAFFAGLAEGVDVARALQAWARETGLARIVFGQGNTVGSMHFHADAFDKFYPLFSVYHPFGESRPARIELPFATWRKRPVLEDEGWRRQFVERLNAIPGVAIPPDKVGAQPTFPLVALADPEAREMFTDAFANLVMELRQASSVEVR
jgi:hypothetical protein